MSLNRMVLVGTMVADPELKYTPSGVPVANFRIAVNRVTKNDAGEYETDFFNITAWRKTADFVNSYLTKGRKVSVDGRLQNRSWVDKESGQKRTVTEIIADNVEGVDKKPTEDGASTRTSTSSESVHSDENDIDPFASE